MEVGCLRHPGASTIGSQFLDTGVRATPMAGKSWQTQPPCARKRKRLASHGYLTVEREGGKTASEKNFHNKENTNAKENAN